jgi:hypothetical protein
VEPRVGQTLVQAPPLRILLLHQLVYRLTLTLFSMTDASSLPWRQSIIPFRRAWLDLGTRDICLCHSQTFANRSLDPGCLCTTHFHLPQHGTPINCNMACTSHV